MTRYKHILAVSGGVDSMVMLEMAYRGYGPFEGLNADDFLVITFDHGTRDGQSGLDARFVMDESKRRGIVAKLVRIRPGGWFLCSHKSGFEEKAREERYKKLRKYKTRYEADSIVLAHHEDDVAETIVMKLVRGTFLRGLVGMRACTNDIWRPLLVYKKTELYAMAGKWGLDWREDCTNKSTKYFRNRIREIMIPSCETALDDKFGPRILNIRKLALEAIIILDDLAEPLIRALHSHEGLPVEMWAGCRTDVKYWVISNLINEPDEPLNLYDRKMRDIVGRLDRLKNGKKVLLAHKAYPIIRRQNKLSVIK